MADVDVKKDAVAILILLPDQVVEVRADGNHRLRQSGFDIPGVHRDVEGGNTSVGQLIDYLRAQQPAVGRQIDPEILLGGVIDDLVGEVGAKERFTAHQRQHPASGVVQPVDRAFGHVLGHAADAVVERPTVVAVEVAFPLVEQIGNDGMKLARHHARAEERDRSSLHGAVNVSGFELAMPILGEEIHVPRGQQLGMLWEDWRRQLLLFPTRTRRQQPGLLGRLHQQLVQLNIKAIRRGGLCNFQYRHFRHRANVLPSFLSFNRENQLVAVRGCYRQLLRRSHQHARQAFLAVHQIVDMQHEIRCYPGVPMNVRYRIEQVAQFRMLGNVVLDVLQPFAGGLQRLLEFHAGLDLGFAQRHLHAAVRVDLPFAGSFYGQENHLLEVVGHSRLYAVRLRRRHAPERLQRQHHVAETVLGIPDVLADFEMSFTPTRELVVEGVRHVGHFFLVDEVVGDVAQALHHAMVLACVDTLAQAPQPLLLAELQLVHPHLAQLIPLHFLVGSIERPAGSGARLRLVHHVHHPGPDRLHQHLRAFTLQEFENVEVAIALGDLRPELADDLDHGLHAQAVHLDGGELLADSRQRLFVGVAVKLLADLGQRVDPDLPLLALIGTDPLRHPLRQVFVVFERLTLAQQGAQLVDGRLEDFICPALLDFVRTDTVDHLVHDVAEVEGIEHAHAEVHAELQPGFA